MTETKQTMPYKLLFESFEFLSFDIVSWLAQASLRVGFAAHALKTVRVSDLSLHFTKGKANRL
jgi:hypothetical protein